MAKAVNLIVYTISFVAPLAFNITIIALPLKVLAVGLTRGTVALVILVSNILQIFGRPFGGYIGDRFGNKKPVIVATFLYAAAYYLFFTSRTILEIMFASAIQGLAVSFL
ncbi:MAG: MFS transporter [Candidatus Njordarchaeia archaeon]